MNEKFVKLFLFFWTSPIRGSSARMTLVAGRHAVKVPSTTRRRRSAASPSTASTSSRDMVRGFSQRTCLPERSARKQCSAWHELALATYTTSIAGSHTSSSKLVARAKPNAAATSATAAASLVPLAEQMAS